MSTVLCLILSCVLFVNGDFVRRKRCTEVDPLVCRVHSLQIEPCLHGPEFCLINTDKSYRVNFEVIPQFSSERVRLAVYGDPENDGTFSSILQFPINVCDLTTCPFIPEEKKRISFNMKLQKEGSGKFPVKLALWDKDNQNLACCTTFTVKVK